MVYNLRFFPSKCSLFHNSNLFGSCIIHILYTGCAKIKKNNSGSKRLNKDDFKMSTGLMPLRWSSREILSTSVLIKVDDFHKLRGSGVLRRTLRWTKSVKNSSHCSVTAKTRHVQMTATCNPTRTSITDSFVFTQCGDEAADDTSNKLYGHHFGTYPRGRTKSGCQPTEWQGSGQTCGQIPLFPRITFSELLPPLQSYRNVNNCTFAQ